MLLMLSVAVQRLMLQRKYFCSLPEYCVRSAFMLSDQSIVDAIMEARSQIDFLWQFFVSVHIAVFAFLLIYDEAIETMNFVARFLVVAALGIFSWVNGHAIVTAYALLNGLHHQFRFQFGQMDKYDPLFFQHFVLAYYNDRTTMILCTHGLAMAVVTLSVFWRRFISRQVAGRSLESK
jgi:hypothetical protein